ncbi:MAG: hypothetical protein HY731_06155 [Candidatus Tectomicrobia bacterium]|nr:hypothetical protein [Candidatus Tectomicrobia bacterium]
MSEEDGKWVATPVKKATCVQCEEWIILPDDVKPGDIITHCEIPQKVTYEFGTYALERI